MAGPCLAPAETRRVTVAGFGSHRDGVESVEPASERAKVDAVVATIRASFGPGCTPVSQVGVLGHADRDFQRGPAFEQKISLDRAKRMRDLIAQRLGPLAARIRFDVSGAGATQMVVPAAQSEADRRRNRRVEITFTAVPKPVVVPPNGKPPDIPPRRPPPVEVKPPVDWIKVIGGDIRAGNIVQHLIDGPAAFRAMADAIATARDPSHFVYLLGWSCTRDVPMVQSHPRGTFRRLIEDASARGAQIRAVLYNKPFSFENDGVVKWLNSLRTGGGVLDRPSMFTSQHQKVLVVKGAQGLIAFCGGVDIYEDRVLADNQTSAPPDKIELPAGAPPLTEIVAFVMNAVNSAGGSEFIHDVHCRITGPAAHDLLRVFLSRWQAATGDTKAVDRKKGPLLGLREPVPPAAGTAAVRIAETRNDRKGKPCRASRGVRQVLLALIASAQKYIYIEDQYLVNLDAARALRARSAELEHITFLVTHPAISDMPDVHGRRAKFAKVLLDGNPFADRIRWYYLFRPGPKEGFGAHTYVHSKTWIFDDEVAVIGSANVNNRGWSSDTEVIAAIFDGRASAIGPFPLPQRLRAELWAEHLELRPEDLLNASRAQSRWLFYGPNAAIRPYDPMSTKGRTAKQFGLSLIPDDLADPKADDLPACPPGTPGMIGVPQRRAPSLQRAAPRPARRTQPRPVGRPQPRPQPRTPLPRPPRRAPAPAR